jgi:hypothetical protein
MSTQTLTQAQIKLRHRPLAGVTDEVLAGDLKKAAGLLWTVCKKYDIDRKSLMKRIARSKILQETLAEIRESAIDHAEFNIFEGVKTGDRWATAQILRYFGRSRGYLEVTRTEITGQNGGPIQVSGVADMTTEQLEALIKPKESNN